MKKYIFIVAFFLATLLPLQAQVAINSTGAAPNNFSMLDVSGTQKGVLIPRITTNDRTTMAGSMGTTEEGLSVYDTDTKSFWFWNGTTWIALGNSTLTADQDWFKEGTTNAPTDINDKMYHLGDVAIGKNTTNAKLDVHDTIHPTTLVVNNANTVTTLPLRTAASFNVNGIPSVLNGITGVYSSVGGDPGNGYYRPLTGFETEIVADDGVNPYVNGFLSVLSGDSDKSFIGIYNDIYNSGGTGDRYGVFNDFEGSSSGTIFSIYGLIENSGDGVHVGEYNRLLGSGNGVQYGVNNRILNSGSKKHFGIVNELKSNGASAHVGALNIIGAAIDHQNPTALDPISGDSDGKRIGEINLVAGDGGGLHIGENNSIISTGDGLHIGSSNVLGYDYINGVNTSTNGLHFGQINNLTDTGNRLRVGNLNLLGATIDPANPSNIVPVTSDSDAKRVGEVNVIAGDGGGIHMAESNNIISTGNGLHIGVSNVLGHDYTTNANTSTDGSQTAVLNNVTDTGAGNHVGTSNVLGLILDPANPNNYLAVSGDSGARRIAEYNIIGGDGAGQHVGISNNIISTGDGNHVGVSNILGYDYINNTNTAVTGKLYGTLNSITDTGTGEHIGNSNLLGIIAPGVYVSGDGNAKRVGSENLIAGDGDGTHYGIVNDIFSSGNGVHYASLNKVVAGGTGEHVASYNIVTPSLGTPIKPHIAVYGEVTTALDPTALAGAFKGYTTSTNQVSTINLFSGSELNLTNTAWENIPNAEAGFVPTIYNNLGNVEVKVIIRVTAGDKNANKFRLKARSSGNNSTLINGNNANWTWVGPNNGKQIVTTEWKPWAAGTAIWNVFLQTKTDGNLKINNVYIVVRPKQAP